MASKSVVIANSAINVLSKSIRCCSTSVRKYNVWTKDNVVKSPFKNIEIPNCTLYDYVWQNLDKWPEKTLSVCASTGRGYTYEQAFKLSNTFAANLRRKLRVRDGDVIAVMLPNIPDFPLIALGIMEAGAVITTLNPVYTAHEIQRQLVMSSAKIVITLPEKVLVIRDALKLAKLDIPIITVKTNEEAVLNGTIAFNELSEDVHVDKSCLKEVKRGINDICFMPYSSGTTGLPKGVELSNRNLIANCMQQNEPMIAMYNETTASHQDIVMAVLPFFHIYGAVCLMLHKISEGIKLVTLADFKPDNFLTALEKSKTNVLFVAPPLVLLMASHPAASTKTFQYIEIIITGAAPLSESDTTKLFERIDKNKIDFRQGYGLTETSPVVAIGIRNEKSYSTSGIPVPSTELRICDNNLRNLGPNETGELLVKGPQVMRGYRNNPKANNEVFTNDGWFRTGDLGCVNEKGLVTITDRLKELIKVKGLQVPPAELEAVIRTHPSVIDAAVVGVPHTTNGEAPKAFVVLKNSQKNSAKEILTFVNERVAPYKRINDLVFVDVIPKSASGKILRRELKDKYC